MAKCKPALEFSEKSVVTRIFFVMIILLRFSFKVFLFLQKCIHPVIMYLKGTNMIAQIRGKYPAGYRSHQTYVL